MARSKSRAQARLMAACAHGSAHPSCPKDPKVAVSFNKRDKGSKLLSDAVREINRNKKGNRFAPGLKPGAAVRRALARGK